MAGMSPQHPLQTVRRQEPGQAIAAAHLFPSSCGAEPCDHEPHRHAVGPSSRESSFPPRRCCTAAPECPQFVQECRDCAFSHLCVIRGCVFFGRIDSPAVAAGPRPGRSRSVNSDLTKSAPRPGSAGPCAWTAHPRSARVGRRAAHRPVQAESTKAPKGARRRFSGGCRGRTKGRRGQPVARDGGDALKILGNRGELEIWHPLGFQNRLAALV